MTLPPESEKVESKGGGPSTNGRKPAVAIRGPISLIPYLDAPPFPVDVLPKTIADMVSALSIATQTDPAMVSATALAALSACVGGHVKVTVLPGWVEQLVLYVLNIAESGERKSPVLAALLKPIQLAEKQLMDNCASHRVERKVNKDVAKDRARRLQREAAKQDDEEERSKLVIEAVEAARQADLIMVPPRPRIIADDATQEAIVTLMAEQGGAISIFSAEGGLLDIMSGRYSNKTNIDVFLKGYSGDPINVDRQGRESQYIEHPAITMGLMIQPSVLGVIAQDTVMRERGLPARFLYSRPVSKVGFRMIAPPAVPEYVEKSYTDLMMSLALGMRDSHVELTLSIQAEDLMTSIATQVETLLAPTGALEELKEWGNKYSGTIVRIAGLLHFAQHGYETEDGEYSWELPISVYTLNAAVKIGEYFRACAVKTFAEMEADKVTVDAKYLLDRLRLLKVENISMQEMHNKCQTHFKKVKNIRPAVERLEGEYLFKLPKPPQTGKGRPPSQRYKFYPDGRDDDGCDDEEVSGEPAQTGSGDPAEGYAGQE